MLFNIVIFMNFSYIIEVVEVGWEGLGIKVHEGTYILRI